MYSNENIEPDPVFTNLHKRGFRRIRNIFSIQVKGCKIVSIFAGVTRDTRYLHKDKQLRGDMEIIIYPRSSLYIFYFY